MFAAAALGWFRQGTGGFLIVTDVDAARIAPFEQARNYGGEVGTAGPRDNADIFERLGRLHVNAILLQRLFACVQKIFLIAFGTG